MSYYEYTTTAVKTQEKKEALIPMERRNGEEAIKSTAGQKGFGNNKTIVDEGCRCQSVSFSTEIYTKLKVVFASRGDYTVSQDVPALLPFTVQGADTVTRAAGSGRNMTVCSSGVG